MSMPMYMFVFMLRYMYMPIYVYVYMHMYTEFAESIERPRRVRMSLFQSTMSTTP